MSNRTEPLASFIPPACQATIPTDSISQAILQHTKSSLLPPIFNHSLRVFLLATQIHAQEQAASSATFTHPSGANNPFHLNPFHLFAACLFHDMGTHSSCNGPQRFEVEGSDAAVSYLRSHGINDHDALQTIWYAIALHTSAGIAERIHPFTRLVRMAVKADFAPAVRDSLGLKTFAAEIEQSLPRLDVEGCLAGAVVAQATRGEKEQGLYVSGDQGKWCDSSKFPKASWPGVLLRGHLEKVRDEGEDWHGGNPAF